MNFFKKIFIGDNENEKQLNFEKLISKADSLMESNKFQEAISFFKKAQQFNNQSSHCFFGIGSCNLMLKNYEESIKNNVKGLYIDPNNNTAIYNVGIAYYNINNYINSIEYFNKIKPDAENYALANFSIGIIEKDNQKACEYFEKAIKGNLSNEALENAKKQLLAKYSKLGFQNLNNNLIEDALVFFNRILDIEILPDSQINDVYKGIANMLNAYFIFDLSNKYYILAGLPNKIFDYKNKDVLFKECGRFVVQTQSGSTSMLQRKFSIGYNRAGRIIDQLELSGVIGPISGSKPREVNLTEPDFEELLQSIGETTDNERNDKIFFKEFSNEYHNLLIGFSKELDSITMKLSKDEIINEKLNQKPNDKLIPYCVYYDCCQVLKILSSDNIDKSGLETFGLSLLIPILASGDLEIINSEYEILNKAFSNKIISGLVDDIIEMSGKKNPLEISVDTTREKEVVSTQNHQNNFSLPIFLKIFDHPLFDDYAKILYQLATILSKADNNVTKEEEEILKGIYQAIHNPIPEETNAALNISNVNKNETLNDALNELESLIGLDGVKDEVRSLINYIKVQKEREKVGLKSSQVSYHCVFTGSPGTGKTTIARIVAKIYMHLGVLKKGHLVETDRSGLVAEYTGQTAVKVNKTVNSAIDGVLFIDEAYSLVGENKDDFGKEAVATLIKRMEDDRDKLIVILAGYTNEMKSFIDTNPGFKSRFNRYIEFSDYAPKEMEFIFKSQCKKLEYILDDEADKKLSELLGVAYENRDKTFGNGRFVRNIFEKTLERQANRIASLPSLTKDILTTITLTDIPEL